MYLENVQVTDTACERLTEYSVYFGAGSLCYCLHAVFLWGTGFCWSWSMWLETFAAGELRGFTRVAANKMPVTLVCEELKL